jgi:hypothetical protein
VQLHRWAAVAITTAGAGAGAVALSTLLPGRQNALMGCGLVLMAVAVPLFVWAQRKVEAHLGAVAEESFRLGLSSRGPNLLDTREGEDPDDSTDDRALSRG